MVETHKKRKNTIITKITLTISNGEHIKHTLSASKHDRHQQHLPKISQNVSGAYDNHISTRLRLSALMLEVDVENEIKLFLIGDVYPVGASS